jgi:two-component system, cell cycle response regulator DivK
MNAILIIEDNEKNLKLLRDVLQVKGYRMLEARTGTEGLRLAREELPALVLMDIQLPDISGITALRQLRADPLTRAIPVVAVSASAMQEEQEKITASGFDGYIMKPIDLKSFLEQVQRYAEPSPGVS